MISIKASTYTTRFFQLAIAVILIGLSIRSLLNRNSLTSLSGVVSDFVRSNKGTDLSMDNTWQTNAATLASSLFSLVSSGVNYFFPTVAIKYYHKQQNVISVDDYNRKTSRYLEVPLRKFRQGSPFSISAINTSYLTSLLGSESVSNAFWFVNTIVSVGSYAKTDCNSVPSLLETYNVTGVSTTTSLLNFFNIYDNSSSSSDLYAEIYSALSQTNVSFENELNGIMISDLNGTTMQSDLLMKMSADCNVKKASMAMTTIMWVAHIFSSGLLTTEFTMFYSRMKSLQVQVTNIMELAEVDNEDLPDGADEGTGNDGSNNNEGEDNNGDSGVVNDDEPPAKDTPTDDDKNNDKRPPVKIFLIFDHRWGLFDALLKRNSEQQGSKEV